MKQHHNRPTLEQPGTVPVALLRTGCWTDYRVNIPARTAHISASGPDVGLLAEVPACRRHQWLQSP